VTMTLAWSAPTHNGGCPITSYHIWMDNAGLGTYSQVDASLVNNIPSLRTYTISSFVSTDTSSTYNFYMVADNIVGSVTSSSVAFVLASTPLVPPTSPTLNLATTTAYQIQVDYAALTTANNGGSSILSYELDMYNVSSGTWISLVGGTNSFSLQNTYLQTSGITKGDTY
jgi:hypothetical protein